MAQTRPGKHQLTHCSNITTDQSVIVKLQLLTSIMEAIWIHWWGIWPLKARARTGSYHTISIIIRIFRWSRAPCSIAFIIILNRVVVLVTHPIILPKRKMPEWSAVSIRWGTYSEEIGWRKNYVFLVQYLSERLIACVLTWFLVAFYAKTEKVVSDLSNKTY